MVLMSQGVMGVFGDASVVGTRDVGGKIDFVGMMRRNEKVKNVMSKKAVHLSVRLFPLLARGRLCSHHFILDMRKAPCKGYLWCKSQRVASKRWGERPC